MKWRKQQKKFYCFWVFFLFQWKLREIHDSNKTTFFFMHFLHCSRSGVPKLESRISDFLMFWVYFPSFLWYCGPKSPYFWQIFQAAAQRTIWVGHPCSRLKLLYELHFISCCIFQDLWMHFYADCYYFLIRWRWRLLVS